MFSADCLPCHAGASGEWVDRGGNEKSVGFGDRLSQQTDQRVVDAFVSDTIGSEK